MIEVSCRLSGSCSGKITSFMGGCVYGCLFYPRYQQCMPKISEFPRNITCSPSIDCWEQKQHVQIVTKWRNPQGFGPVVMMLSPFNPCGLNLE